MYGEDELNAHEAELRDIIRELGPQLVCREPPIPYWCLAALTTLHVDVVERQATLFAICEAGPKLCDFEHTEPPLGMRVVAFTHIDRVLLKPLNATASIPVQAQAAVPFELKLKALAVCHEPLHRVSGITRLDYGLHVGV